jgi:hypothetical protein
MIRNGSSSAALMLASAVALTMTAMSAAAHDNDNNNNGGSKPAPITIEKQGSFFIGGTVLTSESGDTFHGDHAFVRYQTPQNARKLPLVMWHGAGQFGKTWESTPDGREGYQSIFLRRGFSTYIVDQPRRGGAGRATVPVTTAPKPDEAGTWNLFRLGIWNPPAAPQFFPNVQFPRDAASVDQYFRQQTPNLAPGPSGGAASIDAGAKLFDKIGPAILLSHSMGGQPTWPIAIKSSNVKAVISYETSFYVFPEGEVPPPVPNASIAVTGSAVPLADFLKLTKIPIQLVFGDNIPSSPVTNPGQDSMRASMVMARAFVDAINRHGGDAVLLHLPTIGVRGNTHFAFSDLNNVKIADLLSQFLARKGLDKYPGKNNDHDDWDDYDHHDDHDRNDRDDRYGWNDRDGNDGDHR